MAEDEKRDEEGRGGEERRLTLDEIEERYPSVRELRERMGLIGRAMP